MCASREVPLCDLSDEQLAVLVRDSSEEAFSLLVSRCTGMIQFLATAFRQSGVDAEDLAQEGLLGLLFAARTFRENGGAAFRTYASVCIRRRMLSAVRRAGHEAALSGARMGRCRSNGMQRCARQGGDRSGTAGGAARGYAAVGQPSARDIDFTGI